MPGREHEEQAGRLRGRLIRAITRPPFHDPLGRKPWLEWITRAGPHLVRRVSLDIAGWPRWSRRLRVAFLSDFHTGSHSGDVGRLERIVQEARTFNPDLVLLGGDFVNMQLFGGGRVPPRVIAAILDQLGAPCGRFAVLAS
jgi:predicted MPP superfamily phosphohydrolase